MSYGMEACAVRHLKGVSYGSFIGCSRGDDRADLREEAGGA